MTARAVNLVTLDDDTIRESFEHIAANLRPADLDEVKATIGDEDPFWALVESWDQSTLAFLILDDTGLPIGAFGVAPHAAMKVGIAWLIGTPGIEAAALSVARQTKQFVQELQDIYPVLWANVDARNDLSIRWLEWAGFNMIDADPAFGPEERLFLQFIRTG